MSEELTPSKSVPVFALQSPDKVVTLKFQNRESGETHMEAAALISFVYHLTGPRRPQPSEEPERTLYRSLRPWKKFPVPDYVVVAGSGDLTGAPVVAWGVKKQKSLQGEVPWGRPVVGTVVGQEADYWTVITDPAALASAKQQQEMYLAAALEKVAPPPVQEIPHVMEPLPIAEPIPTPIAEPVAVDGTPVEEDKVDFNYTGDPFTFKNGHYIGDDGWVVPVDFDEFYQRYPKYVLNWVKKRLNRFTVDEEVEDWTQDLLIHMKWLPDGSKYRQPGANDRESGCSDVVETFNPYKQYGASERRFRYYINWCLGNKFNTMQSKRQKNPVCRSGNLPYGIIAEDERGNGQNTGDEFVHSNSQHLAAQADRVQKQHDDRLFTNQFKDYVRKEDASVFPAIEALEACGPMGEAAEYMGVTEPEFARYRSRLKQLAECFLKNQQAPRQRKPYKKRAAA